MIRLGALGLVALVAWLSMTPRPPQVAGLPDGADLVVHLMMHFAMASALMLGWPQPRTLRIVYALALGLELGQAVVPGRTVSALDLAANLSGGSWGAGLAAAYGSRLPSRWR